MSSTVLSLGKEPVAIIAAIVGVLNIVQTIAITGISSGVHGVIGLIVVGLGAVLARARVTPTASAPPSA